MSSDKIEVDILNQFKNMIITFIDELINQFPEEPDLVIFRIFIKDQIPTVDLMNTFIHKVLPYKQMIVEKNEDFFLNHYNFFNNKEKINYIKKIWMSDLLDKEDKKTMFKWFESFIFLAEKYQKHKTI